MQNGANTQITQSQVTAGQGVVGHLQAGKGKREGLSTNGEGIYFLGHYTAMTNTSRSVEGAGTLTSIKIKFGFKVAMNCLLIGMP